MKHVKLFEAFVSSQKLNEAFSSQILRNLFSGGGVHSTLPKAVYGKTKIALDKIQDDDLIVTTPKDAYDAKGKNTITFYISDNEKVNPYADPESSKRDQIIPGNEYVLCVADENNKFFIDRKLSYTEIPQHQRMSGKYLSPRSLATDKKRGEETIGINKTNKGYQGTGLISVKRIVDVADRAVIIDVDSLQQRYSTIDKIEQRDSEKVGAIAYKNDRDFKKENLKRYKDILQNSAAKLPLGKMVKDAIDDLTEQIRDGIKEFGKVGKDDNVTIGSAPNGKEVTISHASKHMSRILSIFRKYQYNLDGQKKSKDKYGDAPTWYDEDILKHAQKLKLEIQRIEDFDYAYRYGY